MNKQQIISEKGTIEVITNRRGLHTYRCKDLQGNLVMSRQSAKTYVAAAMVYFKAEKWERIGGQDRPTGEWQEETSKERFYFGRMDLVGKGNSKKWLEGNLKHCTVIRVILFTINF